MINALSSVLVEIEALMVLKTDHTAINMDDNEVSSHSFNVH